MKKKDLILLVLSLVLTVAGAAGLISHFSEVLAGNRADGQLRETWYAQETAEIRMNMITGPMES